MNNRCPLAGPSILAIDRVPSILRNAACALRCNRDFLAKPNRKKANKLGGLLQRASRFRFVALAQPPRSFGILRRDSRSTDRSETADLLLPESDTFSQAGCEASQGRRARVSPAARDE